MRRYKSVNMTPEAIEQYEIGLADDGNFMWLVTRSDESGTASHTARGTWTRSGDMLVFEIIDRSGDCALPTTGTLRGDRLELVGFGTFG